MIRILYYNFKSVLHMNSIGVSVESSVMHSLNQSEIIISVEKQVKFIIIYSKRNVEPYPIYESESKSTSIFSYLHNEH